MRVTCTIGETKITIKSGNIIRKKDGSIVVGINNQMKTYQKDLAENSIHWQLVKKYGENDFKELFRDMKGIHWKSIYFLITSAKNS